MPTVIVHLSNTTSVEWHVAGIVTVSLLCAPVLIVTCCCVLAWCGRETTEQIFCCYSSACFDCLLKAYNAVQNTLCNCGAKLKYRFAQFHLRGARPITIELTPVCKFPEPLKSSPDGACSICLTEFAETDLQAVRLACGHTFHLHCLSEWTALSPSCPLCRAELETIT